ncbi:hypothetical protein JZ751_023532, partial [Albula glossodonta]
MGCLCPPCQLPHTITCPLSLIPQTASANACQLITRSRSSSEDRNSLPSSLSIHLKARERAFIGRGPARKTVRRRLGQARSQLYARGAAIQNAIIPTFCLGMTIPHVPTALTHADRVKLQSTEGKCKESKSHAELPLC